MTQIARAVRPKPLPSQDKPWGRAAIHLLCIYAFFGLWFLRFATNMYGGLDEGRERMADAGMLPYLEGTEMVDPVTSEVTEIGPLNYDLRLELGQDWLYSGYTAEEKQHLCDTFQVDPDQVWQMLVQNVGYADTVENRATADLFYSTKCLSYTY